jgi:hypothetical protein
MAPESKMDAKISFRHNVYRISTFSESFFAFLLEINFFQKFKMVPESKIVFDIAFTEFHLFKNAFCVLFILLLLNFYRNRLFSKIQNGARIQDGCRNLF